MLVGLIVVIAILGIIAAIAVPRLVDYKKLAIERVCESNRDTAECLYEVFLLDNDNESITFNQFLIENFDELCPGYEVPWL